MKQETSKMPLPEPISEFMKKNFSDGCQVKFETVTKNEKVLHYLAEVSASDMIHQLKFNRSGNLVSWETEPAFPSDRHEDFGGEESSREDNY